MITPQEALQRTIEHREVFHDEMLRSLVGSEMCIRDSRSAVRKGMHWLDRAAGVLFIGFGLKLAFTDAPAVRAGH